jgi:mannitol-1-phosphate 5-dehydrogenase
MPVAVQFGAGNIGRGFLGQLFSDGGYEVVFVDVAPELIAALNVERRYPIRLVGPDRHETVWVGPARAVDGRDNDAVAEAVARADIAATAVGAGVLPVVARSLAAGLERRWAEGDRPLDVLIGENMQRGAETMRGYLLSHLSEEARAVAETRLGLVDTVISRMVPVRERAPGESPLLVHVEDYARLPVDASAFRGAIPAIPGLEPRAAFAAYVDRKLYGHNLGHAVAAYTGYRAGCCFIHEAVALAAVRAEVEEVMALTGEALIRRHGFPRAEQEAYTADILRRFANAELRDTVTRVGRDPLRKLGPEERLIGGARLVQEQGLNPERIARAVAVALLYDSPDDPSAQDLQRLRCERGDEAVLREVCGLEPAEPLAVAIQRQLALLLARERPPNATLH